MHHTKPCIATVQSLLQILLWKRNIRKVD